MVMKAPTSDQEDLRGTSVARTVVAIDATIDSAGWTGQVDYVSANRVQLLL